MVMIDSGEERAHYPLRKSHCTLPDIVLCIGIRGTAMDTCAAEGKRETLIIRGIIGGLVQVLIFACLLLVPAGTWRWPKALYFLLCYSGFLFPSIVMMGFLAPASLEARLMRPSGKGQPLEDRIVTFALIAGMGGWIAFIPVDRFHLTLLPPPPEALSILGAVLLALGYGVIWASIFQNAFAAPVVMDQSHRGQVLVDKGLYGCIRHPFYMGTVVFFTGLALWLESCAALAAGVVPLAMLLLRIRIEERTLLKTLPGYRDYMKRVRYRMIPLVF